MKLLTFFVLLLCFSLSLATAQEDDFAIISAENIHRLQAFSSYDFSGLQEGLNLRAESGIFILNDDASQVIVFGRGENDPPLSTTVFLADGEIPWRTIRVGDNQYDRAISDDGLFLAIARQKGADVYFVDAGNLEFSLKSDSPILSLWFSEGKGVVCGESAQTPDLPAQVICSDNRRPVPLFGGQADDFARIGRVAPPLAVTISTQGMVSLWNLEQNEILHQVQVDGLPLVGALNPSGDYLAWRDPESAFLYRLDFVSGENKQIASLEGQYLTHLKISHLGDVIFGVDSDYLWAWIAETGEKIRLGAYRSCGRAPDLAQLSPDGKALVIGCDLGVEVWRIQ